MRYALACVVGILFCGSAQAAEPAPPPHEPTKPTHYVARVTCNANGTIANIILSGGGLPEKGIDFKADVKAFGKQLKELAAKHDKTKPPILTLELPVQLLQAHVIQLVDAAIGAGIEDVSPVPIDKSKR